MSIQCDQVEVDYMDNSNITTHHTIQPLSITRGLQPNDTVLLRRYPNLQRAQADGHDFNFPIMMVYNDVEEAELRTRGVIFPDCPPELQPRGYYG